MFRLLLCSCLFSAQPSALTQIQATFCPTPIRFCVLGRLTCALGLRLSLASQLSLTQVIVTFLCPLVPYLSKCGLHWHIYSGLAFILLYLSSRIPTPCVCFYYLPPLRYQQTMTAQVLGITGQSTSPLLSGDGADGGDLINSKTLLGVGVFQFGVEF